MKFMIEQNEASQTLSFSGEISAHDLFNLKLDQLDRALLDGVGRDPSAGAADHLFLLEMLFRRYQEQMASKPADKR